jgi:hypothetical protein
VKALVAGLEEWKKKKKEKGSEVAEEEVELTKGKCESWSQRCTSWSRG